MKKSSVFRTAGVAFVLCVAVPASADPVCGAGNVTVTTRVISNGKTGAFSVSGTNGLAPSVLTAQVVGQPESTAPQPLAADCFAAGTIVSQVLAPAFRLDSVQCTGLGPGGTATPNLATGEVLLDAAATASNSAITCTFTNTDVANRAVVGEYEATVREGVRVADGCLTDRLLADVSDHKLAAGARR